MRLIALFLAALLALAGCGGQIDNSVVPSFYRGDWTGSWNNPSGQDGGAISMVIQADGSVSGTMTRQPGTSGALSGAVDASGKLTAVGDFGSGGNFIIGGTMLLAGGKLTGGFTYVYLGNEYTASFEMAATSGGDGP